MQYSKHAVKGKYFNDDVSESPTKYGVSKTTLVDRWILIVHFVGERKLRVRKRKLIKKLRGEKFLFENFV